MTTEQVRDLLLPSLLVAFEGSKVQADITVDQKTDSLLIQGYNPETKESLGFAITRQAIEDGVYKATFGPSCKHLRDLLEGKERIDPNLVYPGKDPDFVFPEEKE